MLMSKQVIKKLVHSIEQPLYLLCLRNNTELVIKLRILCASVQLFTWAKVCISKARAAICSQSAILMNI